MKPYFQISIQESQEELIPIPLQGFAVESPHPYEKLGAPYGKKSPYFLRASVVSALKEAQNELLRNYPEWNICIFDAYRPVEVQEFMVNYTFQEVAKSQNLDLNSLLPEVESEIWKQVYQIWAIPEYNPLTPPPHSTGAAIDITIVNDQGEKIDMGGEIDELSARSRPSYYSQSSNSMEQQYHKHRELLHSVMLKAGFRRHPGEWWHFSLGDQMWAWQCQQENPQRTYTARYGRV